LAVDAERTFIDCVCLTACAYLVFYLTYVNVVC
jgi:hypothetical protein